MFENVMSEIGFLILVVIMFFFREREFNSRIIQGGRVEVMWDDEQFPPVVRGWAYDPKSEKIFFLTTSDTLKSISPIYWNADSGQIYPQPTYAKTEPNSMSWFKNLYTQWPDVITPLSYKFVSRKTGEISYCRVTPEIEVLLIENGMSLEQLRDRTSLKQTRRGFKISRGTH